MVYLALEAYFIIKFQRGGRGHRKNPFHGGVWIFSGTTQYDAFHFAWQSKLARFAENRDLPGY